MIDPPKKPGAKGPPVLSQDDADAWRATAGTVQPLRRPKKRVQGSADILTHAETASADGSRTRADTGSKVQQKAGHIIRSAPPKLAPPGSLEPAKARRIRSGRIAIEAKLDLHGLRLAEAHAALRRFVMLSHQQGRRWVLVITGKGGRNRQRTSDGDDTAFRSGEPGLLQQNAPRWLTEPDLGAIVIGFQPASPKHGGDGALYVHLRKRERA